MTHRHEASLRTRPRIEIVLKCDSAGSIEAVIAALSEIRVPSVDVLVIHSGLGAVSKTDVFLAETGSRLVVGFQVDVLPGIERVIRERKVEVRLYNVIYKLTEDIKTIAESIIPPESQEQVIGSAKVIAIFKSSRKGTIIGCEVLDGFLGLGQQFRIISVMGTIYSGVIESIHIGANAVQKAAKGQQAGMKIRDFNMAKVGDLVESFRPLPRKVQPWEPRGGIIRK